MTTAVRAMALLLGALSLSPSGTLRQKEASGRPATPDPRSIPGADAKVVEDGNELRALLSDPDGPKELWLSPKRYDGDLVIRRPVTIRAARGAELRGSGTGTVVDIDAEDVILEGVTVRGSGNKHTTEDAGIKAKGKRVRLTEVSVEGTLFGISLQLCDACVLERSHVVGRDEDPTFRGDGIKLWESNDAIVRDNVMEHSRDMVVWYSRRAHLERNRVRTSRYGTHFMYAHDSVVRDSDLTGNVVGIFVMYSARLHAENNVLAGARGAAGVGIGFKESDGVAVTGNWIVGNTTGVYLDRTPRTPENEVVFRGNVVAVNDTGLRLHGSDSGVRFEDNDFRENPSLVEVEGGGDGLGVTFRHNFFSEYAGYDLDEDGLGDVPFQKQKLSSELTDAHEALRFFRGTAAMELVEMVTHAMPVFASRKLIVDPSPRMSSSQRKSP
jgi:nitrous oxidase accessory protein